MWNLSVAINNNQTVPYVRLLVGEVARLCQDVDQGTERSHYCEVDELNGLFGEPRQTKYRD